MKLKFWQFEYDFDKDDARIVIPLILLVLGFAFTRLGKEILLGVAAAYYALYFFSETFSVIASKLLTKASFRCPYCKSREMLFEDVLFLKGGIAGYDSYLCNSCGRNSIHIDNPIMSRLVNIAPPK